MVERFCKDGELRITFKMPVDRIEFGFLYSLNPASKSPLVTQEEPIIPKPF